MGLMRKNHECALMQKGEMPVAWQSILQLQQQIMHQWTLRRFRLTFLAVLNLFLILSPLNAHAGDCGSGPQPQVDWSECRKRQIILSGSNLDGANLYDAEFSGTDLSNSILDGANLQKTTLIRTSLAKASAVGANLSRIEAYRADMNGLKAKNALFVAAEMQRANLRDAYLVGADFSKAELGRVNFENSNISDVSFRLANLSRANLIHAKLGGSVDMEGAFMFRTHIEGVDLSGVTGLTQKQLDMTCGNEATKLPKGLHADEDWPCSPE